MTYLTFIVGMTEALAWPITVGLLGFAFRKEISTRLEDLADVEFLGNKVSFHKKFDRIEKALDILPEQPIDATSVENHQADDIAALPPPDFQGIPPYQLIISAWEPIEDELERISYARGYGVRSTTHVLRRLKDDRLLKRETIRSIEDLLSLRNAAAHSSSTHAFAESDARRFAKLADEVVSRLRSLS